MNGVEAESKTLFFGLDFPQPAAFMISKNFMTHILILWFTPILVPSRLSSMPSAADACSGSSISLSDTINSFIDNHRGIACFHVKALESDKQFDRFVDRDDCMQELCLSMEKQLGVMSSRAPLHAAAGAPGVGKTRFLLMLQEKKFVFENAKRFMLEPSNAALFHPDNLLVINITFNSIMHTQDKEFTSTIDQMICARLLFQYVLWHSFLIGDL
jgi:hypothetical protein